MTIHYSVNDSIIVQKRPLVIIDDQVKRFQEFSISLQMSGDLDAYALARGKISKIIAEVDGIDQNGSKVNCMVDVAHMELRPSGREVYYFKTDRPPYTTH